MFAKIWNVGKTNCLYLQLNYVILHFGESHLRPKLLFNLDKLNNLTNFNDKYLNCFQNFE